MTPNEILRDFRTKYLHTYAWVVLPHNKEEVLCSIDAITENRDRQAVIQLSCNEYGKLVLNFASTHELRFRFPNVGSFQMGADSMVVLRRAPHRQYQRGLCAANHVVWNCATNLNQDVPQPAVCLESMQAAFKPVKHRGGEALTLLARGKHRSVALDGMFSMVASTDEADMPSLVMGHTFIGRVKDDLTFVPFRGADIYVQEAQRVLTDI